MLIIRHRSKGFLKVIVSSPLKDQIDFYSIARSISGRRERSAQVFKQAQSQGLLSTGDRCLLDRFISELERCGGQSKAQLFQDVFAATVCGSLTKPKFLEFGATDGVSHSNSYLLEYDLGWEGVLGEPSPQWQRILKFNRDETEIISECIWERSGEILPFFVSAVGALSSIDFFKTHDQQSMPTNTKDRLEAGHMVTVETISLNDVIEQYFESKCPEYISIDTEGSELRILEAFNLKKYRPCVFTIEHNFTRSEAAIDQLLEKHDYARVFKDLTAFDAWHVDKNLLEDLSTG